jgi:hypothetical protein
MIVCYTANRRPNSQEFTHFKAGCDTCACRSTLRLQYAPAWRRTLVQPLLQEEDAGIPAVIEVWPTSGTKWATAADHPCAGTPGARAIKIGYADDSLHWYGAQNSWIWAGDVEALKRNALLL